MFLVYTKINYGQCNNNLIHNGSFEPDSVGENIVGMFWGSRFGSLDIDDASDEFWRNDVGKFVYLSFDSTFNKHWNS